jgi:hypothetical protein
MPLVRSVVRLTINSHLFPFISITSAPPSERSPPYSRPPALAPFHDTVPSPCTTSPSVAHVAFHNARVTTLAITCQHQVRAPAPPRLASSPSARLEIAHSSS